MVVKEPTSLKDSLIQGVQLGLKWMTFIIGPFALLSFIIAIGITLYRFFCINGMTIFTNSELRWETLKILGSPFGVYLVSCMWGIVAGVIVCPSVYIVKRIRKNRN
jgi:hypothetical protein